MLLWKYVAYIDVYKEMGGAVLRVMFLFLYGGSNVKRSKNMFKVFSCLKGGEKEEGRFNDYEDFRRFLGGD